MACKDCKYFQRFQDAESHAEGYCSINNYTVSPGHSCEFYEDVPARAVKPKKRSVAKYPKRKGMNIASIVCFVFAAIYLIMSFSEALMMPAAVFFLTLGVMFSVLARSPKYIPYILGRDRGLKKWQFVVICIVACYVLIVVATSAGFTTESVSVNETVVNTKTAL